MASKKDFTQSIANNPVYSTIAQATELIDEQMQFDNSGNITEPAKVNDAQHTRKTYTKEETQEFLAELKSAGRKGVHLPRINMAFSPQLYDYIRTMSKVSGITLTEFVNTIIKQYMDEHMEQYEKAIEFRNNL